MESCILHQNKSSTLIVLDIPRSLELAQGFLPSKPLRLISSAPQEQPFPSTEPKSAQARARLGDVSIEDLLLQKHLQLALDELKKDYKGDWCFPRAMQSSQAIGPCRRRNCDKDHESLLFSQVETKFSEGDYLHQNPSPVHTILNSEFTPQTRRIPPYSTFLHGSLPSSIPLFTSQAPQFSLILLDPPWTNRSARRKNAYSMADKSSIASLLQSIPIASHLAPSGLVTIWITNRPAFRELVVGPNGIFESWGVSLIEQWIWIKVTTEGEPVLPLDGVWRKPWEVLLVGKKMAEDCGEGIPAGDVKRRVIAAVPDLHSRKPCLKQLYEEVFGLQRENYNGLEIFARGLIERWWSWGNEVLKFQGSECWLE